MVTEAVIIPSEFMLSVTKSNTFNGNPSLSEAASFIKVPSRKL